MSSRTPVLLSGQRACLRSPPAIAKRAAHRATVADVGRGKSNGAHNERREYFTLAGDVRDRNHENQRIGWEWCEAIFLVEA